VAKEILMPAKIRFGYLALAALIPSISPAQQTSVPVSLVRMEVDIAVDYGKGALDGTARLRLRNHEKTSVAQIPLQTHRLMEVSAVTDARRTPLTFSQDVVRFTDWPSRQVNQVYVNLPRPIAPGDSVDLDVKWNGILSGYSETGMLYVRDKVDSAFTILRSETRAFPVVALPTEKLNRAAPRDDFEFTARITVPANQVVAMGGSLRRRTESGGLATYEYRSSRPAGWVNIAIAPYRQIDSNGLHIYYFPADSAGAVQLASAAQQALDRMALWFGPMSGSLDLPIVEIPDGFGSQASLTAGIIQSAAAFRSKDAIGQLYHELSHLWNAPDLDVRSPRWNEGLASFLEDLLTEQLDGWKDRDARAQRYAAWFLQRFDRDSTNGRMPFIQYGEAGKTDLSYGVGYFMFSALYETLGADGFNRAVGGYYQKYAKTGGTTRQFADFVIAQSPCDVKPLFDEWLYSTAWHQRLGEAKQLRDLAYPCAPYRSEAEAVAAK
jgi:hypothetical protein